MNLILRISLLIGILVYLALVLTLLKKKTFILKYALIWFISAMLLLILDIFPGIISFVASSLGFQLTANAIFILIIFFILLVLISLTSIASPVSGQ